MQLEIAVFCTALGMKATMETILLQLMKANHDQVKGSQN